VEERINHTPVVQNYYSREAPAPAPQPQQPTYAPTQYVTEAPVYETLPPKVVTTAPIYETLTPQIEGYIQQPPPPPQIVTEAPVYETLPPQYVTSPPVYEMMPPVVETIMAPPPAVTQGFLVESPKAEAGGKLLPNVLSYPPVIEAAQFQQPTYAAPQYVTEAPVYDTLPPMVVTAEPIYETLPPKIEPLAGVAEGPVLIQRQSNDGLYAEAAAIMRNHPPKVGTTYSEETAQVLPVQPTESLITQAVPQVRTQERLEPAMTQALIQISPEVSTDDVYCVGAGVEVFSKSFGTWFRGAIAQHGEGGMVLAEFVASDGKVKEKWMPRNHEELRPATAVSPAYDFTMEGTVAVAPEAAGVQNVVAPPTASVLEYAPGPEQQVISGSEWIGGPHISYRSTPQAAKLDEANLAKLKDVTAEMEQIRAELEMERNKNNALLNTQEDLAKTRNLEVAERDAQIKSAQAAMELARVEQEKIKSLYEEKEQILNHLSDSDARYLAVRGEKELVLSQLAERDAKYLAVRGEQEQIMQEFEKERQAHRQLLKAQEDLLKARELELAERDAKIREAQQELERQAAIAASTIQTNESADFKSIALRVNTALARLSEVDQHLLQGDRPEDGTEPPSAPPTAPASQAASVAFTSGRYIAPPEGPQVEPLKGNSKPPSPRFSQPVRDSSQPPSPRQPVKGSSQPPSPRQAVNCGSNHFPAPLVGDTLVGDTLVGDTVIMGSPHGAHVASLEASEGVIVYPFARNIVPENVSISEDFYNVRRVHGCFQTVLLGSQQLERQVGGLYFEVRISGIVEGVVGGLAIGVTHTPPITVTQAPSKAEEVPGTVTVGYAGSVYLNGYERALAWNPGHLQIGQRLGLLITDDGKGDLIVFEDQKPVAVIDGRALSEAGIRDAPLYPVVELFGATSGVTLCPRASVPARPWTLPETATPHRQPPEPLTALMQNTVASMHTTQVAAPVEGPRLSPTEPPKPLSPVLEPANRGVLERPTETVVLGPASTQEIEDQSPGKRSQLEKFRMKPSDDQLQNSFGHRGPYA
jgi:hypothetical protein